MKRVISIATAGVTACLLALTISVSAQDFNPMEKTYLTFSGPVELPGVRLEAGTYVFRLADTSGRNVVQVLTRDEKDILGQWLFVQAERRFHYFENAVYFRLPCILVKGFHGIQALARLRKIFGEHGYQNRSVVHVRGRHGIEFALEQDIGLLPQHLKEHQFQKLFEVGYPARVAFALRLVVSFSESYQYVNFESHVVCFLIF